MDLILASSIIAGQLVKLPVFSSGGLILLDLVVLAILFLGFWKKPPKIKNLPLFFKLGLVFACIGLLSLILTPLHLSFSQNLISFFYTIRFLIYLLFGLLVYNKSLPKLNQNLLTTLLFSGLGMAILGFFQFIFFPDLEFLSQFGWDPHYFRLVSSFLDPNFTGAFLALTLILLTSKFGEIKHQRIFFTILFISLLLTFSRGAYLMFASSFLCFSILKRSPKWFLATGLLSIILFFGFYFYQKDIAGPRKIDRNASAKFRENSFGQGLAIFEKNPVLGVGFNAYRFALSEYNLAPPDQINSHGGSSNDFSVLFILATTGVIGFLTYLFFLSSILKISLENFKKISSPTLVVLPALAGLLVASFSINVFFYPPIMLWVFAIAGLEKS